MSGEDELRSEVEPAGLARVPDAEVDFLPVRPCSRCERRPSGDLSVPEGTLGEADLIVSTDPMDPRLGRFPGGDGRRSGFESTDPARASGTGKEPSFGSDSPGLES